MSFPAIQRIKKIRPPRHKRPRKRKSNPNAKPKSIYNTDAYKRWRSRVFRRDHYTCQMCHTKRSNGVVVRIEAHHIMRKVDFPELIFVVSNGITLCKDCHLKVTGNEYEFAQLLMDIVKQKGRRPSPP